MFPDGRHLRAPLLAAVLSLFLPTTLRAQTVLASEAWRWSSFTTEAGLPSDQVLEVLDADDGTPWAATTQGLAWYDGFRWHRALSVPPLPVSLLSPVPGGQILALLQGRLYRGDQNGFRRISLPPHAQGQVRGAAALSSDTLLILAGEGLHLFDGEELRGLEPPGRLRGDPPVAALWRTRPGRVWLNTDDGLFRRDGDGWRLILGASRATRFHIAEIREGPDSAGLALVLAPERFRGVWTWKGDATPTRSPELLTRFARTGDVDSRGHRLVAYQSGHLIAQDRDGWTTLPRLTFGGGVPSLVRYRPNGDLWVGSDRGLYLYRSSSVRWSHWTHPFGDPRNRVNEILISDGGDVWIATFQGVEIRQPDGSSHWVRRIRGRELGQVTGLAQDVDGGIWISSGSSFTGAYRWDGESWVHHGLSVPGDSTPTHIHKIRRDSSSRLWFLGMYHISDRIRGGPGAFVLDGGEPEWWAPSSGLSSGRVYDFARGPDGALWFATLDGLNRWHEGRWTRWRMEDGLRIRRVFTVAVDRHGTVWFGDQSNGLGRLDPATGEIEYLTTADGLVSNQVWEVREAPSGALWVSTAGGLARYMDGQWDGFRTDDGLGGLQTWPVRPEEDRLLVGTLNWGVTVLDLTDQLRTAPRVAVDPPALHPLDVRMNWKAFSYWGQVPQSRIPTRWRVDEGPWSEWSTVREAHLSNLEPGSHTFQVQARGPLGAVRESGAIQSFQVPLPFYRRLAFLVPVVGLGLLALLLLGLGNRRRTLYRLELEEQERRYRSFFEDDLTGDLIVDRLGYILECNPAFARIFGFDDSTEAIGTRVTELMSWSVLKGLLQGLRARGKLEYYEMELRDRRGQPLHVIANLTAIFNEREKLRRVRAYVFDNTERKELEERLIQSQKMEAVGRLAGGIAHDFNNLLTAINGYAELVLSRLGGDDPMRDDLMEIQHAGARGKELTSQLLAFGRRQMLSPRKLDLDQALTRMLPLLERAMGAEGTLTHRHGPEPLTVRIDSLRLEQAILNLVLNARDAVAGVERGTVALRTRAVRVDRQTAARYEGAAPGPYAVIQIQDNGVGIPLEDLDRIFEPFFTTKEVGEGTGLGLPTVYGIVQQSRGFLTVESQEGEGTTFAIYLPLLDEDTEPEEEAPRKRPEAARVSG